MKYEILKDTILKCWIVWEKHNNYKVDVYQAKTKKECLAWLKNGA